MKSDGWNSEALPDYPPSCKAARTLGIALSSRGVACAPSAREPSACAPSACAPSAYAHSACTSLACGLIGRGSLRTQNPGPTPRLLSSAGRVF